MAGANLRPMYYKQCSVVSTGCCGFAEIKEMSYLPDPESALAWIIPSFAALGYDKPFAFFTGVTGRKRGDHIVASAEDTRNYGEDLAKKIEELGLGTITRVPPQINPRTTNELGVWIWSTNWPAMNTWQRNVGDQLKLKLEQDAAEAVKAHAAQQEEQSRLFQEQRAARLAEAPLRAAMRAQTGRW